MMRRNVVISRHAAGSYIKGVWTEGSTSAITIKATVQPLKPLEMQALPEGRRSSRAMKVYTETLLLSANEDGKNADTFSWLGATWEIISCEPYQNSIISHYRAYAVEVKSY